MDGRVGEDGVGAALGEVGAAEGGELAVRRGKIPLGGELTARGGGEEAIVPLPFTFFQVERQRRRRRGGRSRVRYRR